MPYAETKKIQPARKNSVVDPGDKIEVIHDICSRKLYVSSTSGLHDMELPLQLIHFYAVTVPPPAHKRTGFGAGGSLKRA